jgi:NAD(P)-dependent dehydrogenase (short-subunit alcohol dehydrogenase family)
MSDKCEALGMTTEGPGALDGQHVLVTGGSSGIGKACAARYRAEGATVFVADLHPQSSDEIQLDVADPMAWAALIERLPPLDMVHLNAGITTPGRDLADTPAAPLADVTVEAYRTIVGVNLDGVFFGAQAVLPGMVERGTGNLVVTASMAGLGGMPGDVVYAATKHAVVGLVKSLGVTLERSGNTGVCVSAICPGFVNTPLVPSEAQEFVSALGMPVIEPSRVAEAVMQAVAAGANGSQWIVWGDVIRQHVQPEFDLA